MLKFFLLRLSILLCVVNQSWERPQGDGTATILKSNSQSPSRTASGNVEYSFNYETSNQIKAEETGTIINPDSNEGYLVVRGSYSYVGPDGITYEVVYIADKDGFQPSGAHIKGIPGSRLTPFDPPLIKFVPPGIPPPQYAPPALIASLQGGGLG